MTHRRREQFDTWVPLHVTLRIVAGQRSLRGCGTFRVIHAALAARAAPPVPAPPAPAQRAAVAGAAPRATGAAPRATGTAPRVAGVARATVSAFPQFRLIEYSVQTNHLHLIVEARSARDLSRGMQGLAIRVARAVNKRFRRRGKLFRERYFSRTLRDPLAARNARRYVLNNARRHQRGHWRVRTTWVDPCSSAPFFEGFTVPRGTPRAPPTQRDTWLVGLGTAAVAPVTWLLREGYSRAGPLVLTDVPGPP